MRRSLRRRLARAAGLATLGMLLLPAVPVVFLRWIDPVTSSFMVQHCYDGTIGSLLNCARIHRWVDWKDISPYVPIAVVASEDQKFPDHAGFDFDSIVDAVRERVVMGRVRGASTISQQVAKNLFLWPGKSLARKGLEAYLTVVIELTWPKRRILEVYLNISEFGNGVYGVGAASELFFAKAPAALSLEESALLAAVLPNPSRMHVDHPGPYVRDRTHWIVEQVNELGRDYLGDL